MLFRQLTQLDPDYYLGSLPANISSEQFPIPYLLLLIGAGDHTDDLDVGAFSEALLLLMVKDELLLLGWLDLPPVVLVPLLLLLVRPPQVGV